MKRFHEKSEGASAVSRASVMQKSLRGAVCASLLLLSGSMAQAQTAGATIFEGLCEENPDAIRPHRIPAIVETSGGDILVFADKRWGYGDIGQYKTGTSCNGATSSQIDIRFRRGSNFGEGFTTVDPTTITPEFVWNSAEHSDAGSGDAAVVANRENPAEILVMAGAGEVFFTDSRKDGDKLQIRRLYSNDGGQSWTYSDLTDDIYAKVGYDGIFFSSGRILQSSYKEPGKKYYRLYAVLCTQEYVEDRISGWISSTDGRVSRSVLVSSDDFGASWDVVGAAIEQGDEAKAVELPNGEILVVAKSMSEGTSALSPHDAGRSGRTFNIYDPNAKTFEGQKYVAINSADACNGEILVVPAVDAEGNATNYLLMSMPSANNDRANVGIYYRELPIATDYKVTDIATTDGWGFYQLSSTTSAYSSMILQSNGKVGVVYEDVKQECGGAPKWSFEHSNGCKHQAGYNIVYKSLDISEIVSATETEEVSAAIAKKMNKHEGSHAADITPVEDKSWASLFWPVAVQLPEGTTAYVVSSVSEDQTSVILSELGSQIVPANEPVILRANEASEVIYLTPVASTETFSGTNLLEGSTGNNQEITDDNYKNFYVLSHGSKCEGFYYTINGYIPANLAYLPLTNGATAASVLKLQIGDGVTGIGSVMTGATEGTNRMFDLSGRRVQDTAAPGIYIVNGKKVLVK